MLSFFSPGVKMEQKSIYARMRALYAFSATVPQSEKLGQRFEEISAARIRCYHTTPIGRLDICSKDYTYQILEAGRQEVDSAPDLGNFISQVSYCPIVHSICMGEKDDLNQCIKAESQCIDGMLDLYWRGKPFQSLY